MRWQSVFALLAGLVVLARLAGGQDQPSGEFIVDPGSSTVTIEVGKTGMLGFAGHNHEVTSQGVSGKVSLDSGDITRSAVSLEIDAASLRVTGKGDPAADVPEVQKVMLSDRVLDVARFPTISFRSRRVSRIEGTGASTRLQIEGDLTLHGVTRPVTITPDVAVASDGLTARARFSIKQTDFGIHPVTAGGGTVRVRDEVDIAFVVRARKR